MAHSTKPQVKSEDPLVQIPNAFANQASQPTEADLRAALVGAKPVWDALIAKLADDHGINVMEWRCHSVKAGWSMRLKRGKRTIVWLSPCPGCFQVVFILGAKALQAASESRLSAAGLEALDRGVKYPEGTCIRLLVKSVKDLGTVKTLAVAKIEN